MKIPEWVIKRARYQPGAKERLQNIVDLLVRQSEKALLNGLLSLDDDVHEIESPFLGSGLIHIAHGIDS